MKKKIFIKRAPKISPKQEILKSLKVSLLGIEADGGLVEIVKINKRQGIVEVKMAGSCCGCPFRDLTFAKMIAEKIRKKVRWVKDVKLVK